LGIELIGDLPIYVPYDSCDVWAAPHLFQLNDEGIPTAVAGCPPDAFSAEGQLWGNPLYRWDRMAEDDFLWWRNRL
jgi:4-alpha-glucanotransferase